MNYHQPGFKLDLYLRITALLECVIGTFVNHEFTKQGTRNLTLHEAQQSAVLNVEILVCKRVLRNPDNT